MAIAVEMPKMSDTMEEGVLVTWLVEEGDAVEAGDIIAQVETDKATMDLEVYDDGVLLKKMVTEGSGVPIGGLIAVLGKEGEEIDEILARYANGASSESITVEAESLDEEVQQENASKESKPSTEPEPISVHSNGDTKASPLARKMASEANLDLRQIAGSGPDGRVVKRDVEAAMKGAAPAVAARSTSTQTQPAPSFSGKEYETHSLSQMRKTIAKRLAESKFTAPHFYLTMEVDMENAVKARASINEVAEGRGEGKVSFNDMITKACALGLKMHPAVNSSWAESEGAIYQHNRISVAIAVAIDEGLVTPVIRDADLKSLTEIASETKDLAAKARDRKLQPEDWEGSTFTTSNLGMFGIEEFTAIINPPNSCILAIGAIMDVPVVKDGSVVPGKRMRVTLSCDHRVVDGATGAAFLGDVKRFLEDPVRMFV